MMLSGVVNRFCDKEGLCLSAFFFVVGKNKGEVELDSRISNYSQHIAHEVAIKQFHHYWQLAISGRFCQFDYKADNMKMYKKSSPPNYSLDIVKAPIYLYSGSCDA